MALGILMAPGDRPQAHRGTHQHTAVGDEPPAPAAAPSPDPVGNRSHVFVPSYKRDPGRLAGFLSQALFGR